MMEERAVGRNSLLADAQIELANQFAEVNRRGRFIKFGGGAWQSRQSWVPCVGQDKR